MKYLRLPVFDENGCATGETILVPLPIFLRSVPPIRTLNLATEILPHEAQQ